MIYLDLVGFTAGVDEFDVQFGVVVFQGVSVKVQHQFLQAAEVQELLPEAEPSVLLHDTN